MVPVPLLPVPSFLSPAPLSPSLVSSPPLGWPSSWETPDIGSESGR